MAGRTIVVIFKIPECLEDRRTRPNKADMSGHPPRSAFIVLMGKPEGKRPLGNSKRRGEDNIKMDVPPRTPTPFN